VRPCGRERKNEGDRLKIEIRWLTLHFFSRDHILSGLVPVPTGPDMSSPEKKRAGTGPDFGTKRDQNFSLSPGKKSETETESLGLWTS